MICSRLENIEVIGYWASFGNMGWYDEVGFEGSCLRWD
jgi:hypothetical protein